MRLAAVMGAAFLGALACQRQSPAARAERADSAPSTPAPPADSLVATTRSGTQVWFTLARADSGEAGRCTARAVEIRQGDTRIPVPLLYTSTAPEILNDTTMRASLSDHCRPGDRYLVDLRTGRPVRERP